MGKVEEKIKEAIGRGVGWAFLDFFRKEYVEKERYDELFALWMLTYPKLRHTDAECMGFECWDEKCEIKGRVIVTLEDVEKQLLEQFREAASRIIEGIEKELRETKPKNIHEKVELEIKAKAIREKAKRDIEEILKKEYLSGYDKILDVCILDSISHTIDKVLGGGKAREYFRKKVEENIALLTPKGKLAFLVLSVDPAFVECRGIDLWESSLSDRFRIIWDIIIQESNKFSEAPEAINELIMAGLLAEGWWYSRKHCGSHYVVPPFSVEFWENAVNNPVIINDVPREIVERVRTIISWRRGQNGGGENQIF